MAGKRDKTEEIVLKLRQLEVLQGQGSSIADAVRQIGVTQQTYYRWRKEYGGMSRDQLKTAEGAGEREYAAQACRVGSDSGQNDPDRGCPRLRLSGSIWQSAFSTCTVLVMTDPSYFAKGCRVANYWRSCLRFRSLLSPWRRLQRRMAGAALSRDSAIKCALSRRSM
jgi:hypothetical protein